MLGIRCTQGHVQRESTALADLTGDQPQLTAQPVCELTADRQAEAGAAVFS
ncbi:hypothetical protein D3C86_862610 [compost metagenome]